MDEKTQGDLLAVTTPIAKEADFDVAKHFDVFSCELCSFKCTEPEEMKVHCVGHYYQDLKEMCGSSAGNRSCIQCQFKTTNVFEYIMHLGIKHKKLLDFASEPMKDLFNKLIGEEVAEFMAKINEESEADMTENTAEVDDGEEEEDEDETAGEENNQALEEEEDIGGEDDEGEVD